jgi:hypothetical protein
VGVTVAVAHLPAAQGVSLAARVGVLLAAGRVATVGVREGESAAYVGVAVFGGESPLQAGSNTSIATKIKTAVRYALGLRFDRFTRSLQKLTLYQRIPHA